MGKLINRIPSSRLLISNLLGSALRTLVELVGKPLKNLPGKLEIKRHLVFSICLCLFEGKILLGY